MSDGLYILVLACSLIVIAANVIAIAANVISISRDRDCGPRAQTEAAGRGTPSDLRPSGAWSEPKVGR